MFTNIDLLYIFGPAMIIALVVLMAINNARSKQNLSHLNKAIEHFKATSMVFGFLLLILWLSVPSTSSLKTFGYPEDISKIKDEVQILNLFQEYNKAIVRTAEVLQWFLFLFVWWFLTSLFGVVKSYKNIDDKAFAHSAQ